MQTFLPYPNYRASARCLDYRRLGKQRVEAMQILRALYFGKGWIHHPATKMWKGYENSLVLYGLVFCEEWVRRGYVDNCAKQIYQFCNRHQSVSSPPWLGDRRFHDSHKSKLLQKKPEFYGNYCWGIPDDLDYWWPV